MPLYFDSLKREHRACRAAAGCLAAWLGVDRLVGHSVDVS